MTSDQELKLALCGLLPKQICVRNNKLFWGDDSFSGELPEVLETEWLHICHLVEMTLEKEKLNLSYAHELYNVVVPEGQQPFMASWQQRTAALLKVKGVNPS